MTVRASVACIGLCFGCANPNPSTLNQKCFADENCDDGQVCVKADDEDAGFCRNEDDVLDSGDLESSTTLSVMTTGTTAPTTTAGPTSSPPTTNMTLPLTGGTTDMTTGEMTTMGEDSSGSTTGEQSCAGVPRPDVVEYGDASTYVTDANPQGIALGDLDNDGELDIAVTSYADGTIQTFLGDGFGNFTPDDTSFAGTNPGNVVLGAVADATADAIVYQSLGQAVLRLQGNGDGSFGNAQTSGRTFGAIALADVDNDDVLDLLGTDTVLTVALGNAVGESFGDYLTYPSGLSAGPGHVAAGDFDGNGSADVVMGHGFELVVMLGNGAGTFVAQPVRAVGGYVVGVAVGDFNADGEDDVVAITAGGGTDAQRIFIGNGDGTLANLEEIVGSQTTPMQVTTGDMDADGDDDIFVTHVGGSTGITVANGDGSFAPQELVNCDGNPRGIAVGLIDDDCVLDIVSVSSSAENVCVWLSE